MLVETDSPQQQQSVVLLSHPPPAQQPQPQHSSSQQQQLQDNRYACSRIRRPTQTQLVLKLARRQPNLVQLHELCLLKQVVVLDTAAAKRGVLSIGVSTADHLAGKLLGGITSHFG